MSDRKRTGDLTSVKKKQTKLDFGQAESVTTDSATAENIVVEKNFAINSSIKPHYEYVHTVTLNSGSKAIVLKCKVCDEPKRAPVGNVFNFRKHLQVAHKIDATESQPKLDKWVGLSDPQKLPLNHPFQLKIDRCIAKAIAIDGLPLNLTSGDGFRELLSTANKSITIKSRRTMTRKINCIAKEIVSKLELEDISKIPNERIHVIVDIWSNRSHESVLGIKIQYLNDDLQMVNKMLAFEEFNEDHTAENIKQKVIEVFRTLGLKASQIGSIVADRGSSMVTAFNLHDFYTDDWDPVLICPAEESHAYTYDGPDDETGMSGSEASDMSEIDEAQEQTFGQGLDTPQDEISYGWDFHGCLAHRLQNVINASIKKDKEVKEIIDVANRIINFFRRSPKWMSRLKSLAGKIVLGIGNTRWNSIIIAMERIIDDQMFLHIESVLKEYNSKCRKNQLVHIPTLQERKRFQEVLLLLAPFKEATVRFQSNSVTSSIVLNAVFDLQNRLIKFQCQYFNNFRRTLLCELEKNGKGEDRFKGLMKDVRFVIAAILDPRFKLRLFAPKGNEQFFPTYTVEEAIKEIQKVYDKLSSRSNSAVTHEQISTVTSKGMFSFLDELDAPQIPIIRSELDAYLEEATVSAFTVVNSIEKELDILQYWRENKFRFPILYEMVKIYLSIPASSGDVERLFSVAGTLKRHHRNKLTNKQLKNILIVKYNHLNKLQIKSKAD